MGHVNLCKPKTSKFNWVYLVKVDDALSHRVSQRVDVLLLLFRYAVYSDVGNGHDTGRSPERHRTRYDPIHLPISVPLICKVVPKPHCFRFDANVLIARIPIQIQIQIFIDTLAAESRITCYEQKCLKTTKMTHNKSIGTDTHTYTDIYWQSAA